MRVLATVYFDIDTDNGNVATAEAELVELIRKGWINSNFIG